MDKESKDYTKAKFGACLLKIINNNKLVAAENKHQNIENIDLVSSLRKLAASSTVDFAMIQKIATAQKNPAWSTVTLVIKGLGMTTQEWGKHYDEITDADISTYLQTIKNAKNPVPSKEERKIINKKK